MHRFLCSSLGSSRLHSYLSFQALVLRCHVDCRVFSCYLHGGADPISVHLGELVVSEFLWLLDYIIGCAGSIIWRRGAIGPSFFGRVSLLCLACRRTGCSRLLVVDFDLIIM